MANPVTFSSRTKKILSNAAEESRRTGAAMVEPEHLLLGILLEGQSLAYQALNTHNITAPDLRDTIRQLRIARGYQTHFNQPALPPPRGICPCGRHLPFRERARVKGLLVSCRSAT